MWISVGGWSVRGGLGMPRLHLDARAQRAAELGSSGRGGGVNARLPQPILALIANAQLAARARSKLSLPQTPSDREQSASACKR